MAKTITPRTNIVRGFHATQAMVSAAVHLEDPAAAVDHSERILLLEDEAETNEILKEYLQSLGYRVIAVANGVEGLKEVMKSDFELIICDMMMPRLPGDMFYLAVQKTRPHLCNRFVFITGHQESPVVDAFIARTHAAILVKPFRLHQLEITLEGVLSRFPRKIQAVPSTLRTIPNDENVRVNDQVVIQKHRQSFEEVPEKKEAVPSIVVKALKIVGFMRNNSKVVPPPLESIPAPAARPQQTPKVTQRFDQVKRTRVIPELAHKPIVRPSEKTTETDHSGSQPRVTRKTAEPENLVVRLPKTAATGQKAVKNVTVRVKNLETPAAKPSTRPRVTRKTEPPKATTPKVTRQTPKATIKVAPQRTIAAPKTTRKVTQKVTRKVEKKGASSAKK